MVLAPSEIEYARMQRLMNDKTFSIPVWWRDGNVTAWPTASSAQRGESIFVPSDPGDQSIWRSFYSRVTELPIGYNAFKKTNFRSASDWEHVHILHDIDVSRGRAIPWVRSQAVYTNLTTAARLLVSSIARELGVADRG